MKTFETILEGILRAKRMAIASSKANTRLQALRGQQETNPFQDIINLFRRNERQETLKSDIASVEQKIPNLTTARQTAIEKVRRSVVNRRDVRGKDTSTEGNRLKAIVGLEKSISKHQNALVGETNPEKIAVLRGKIAKAQRNRRS
jgi:hypothetical protein